MAVMNYPLAKSSGFQAILREPLKLNRYMFIPTFTGQALASVRFGPEAICQFFRPRRHERTILRLTTATLTWINPLRL
jgi:hypothetical protein